MRTNKVREGSDILLIYNSKMHADKKQGLKILHNISKKNY
jgi:hypothetical protein